MTNKIFTIIGGGFGLYGYMPALVQMGYSVALNGKYKKILLLREELTEYYDVIKWYNKIEEIMDMTSSLVITIPPYAQADLVQSILERYTNVSLYLEKPVAATPSASIRLQNTLKKSNTVYKIGYLFLYTDWYNTLSKKIHQLNDISIVWRFKAHHLQNSIDTWKSDPKKGGGLIRFYGIHLIAVLASLKYYNVKDIHLYDNVLIFKVGNNKNRSVTVLIDIDSQTNEFTISNNINNQIHYHGTSPFITNKKVDKDCRITYIKKYIKMDIDMEYIYLKTDHLWLSLEKKLYQTPE